MPKIIKVLDHAEGDNSHDENNKDNAVGDDLSDEKLYKTMMAVQDLLCSNKKHGVVIHEFEVIYM